MQKHQLIGVCVAAALTVGASDLSKFYQVVPHKTPDAEIKTEATFHPSSGDAKADVMAMETAGYELVGYSAFNGKESGQKAVAKEAKKVGATDVVYFEKYTDTQNAGAIGNTSFSRWGAFSFVTPMSVRRYDQLALYFRKALRQGIGIYPRALSNDEKSEIGSNKGLTIVAVVNGSPAFMSDILPGDIITSLGHHPVWDSDSFQAAINGVKGTTAEVTLFRSGQPLTKNVLIPVGNW
jgi:S1-C subfamily serine protease